MNLELKHLAPYLPYGLKVGWNNIFHEMISLKSNERCQLVDNFTDEIYGIKLVHIKPILRPLSDLIKEIEHNGERFVPLEKLEVEGANIGSNIVGIVISIVEDYEWIYLQDVQNNITQKLFEWHFDVFNLIEKGLAIDINTLKS